MTQRYWKFKNEIVNFEVEDLRTTVKKMVHKAMPQGWRLFRVSVSSMSESVYITLLKEGTKEVVYFRVSSHAAYMRTIHNYDTTGYENLKALEHDLRLDLGVRLQKMRSYFTLDMYEAARELDYLELSEHSIYIRAGVLENLDKVKISKHGLIIKKGSNLEGVILDEDYKLKIRNLLLRGYLITIPTEDDMHEIKVSYVYKELCNFFKPRYEKEIWTAGIELEYDRLIDRDPVLTLHYATTPLNFVPRVKEPAVKLKVSEQVGSGKEALPIIKEQVTSSNNRILYDIERLGEKGQYFVMRTKALEKIERTSKKIKRKLILKQGDDVVGVITDENYMSEFRALILEGLIEHKPLNDYYSMLTSVSKSNVLSLECLLDVSEDAKSVYYREVGKQVGASMFEPRKLTLLKDQIEGYKLDLKTKADESLLRIQGPCGYRLLDYNISVIEKGTDLLAGTFTTPSSSHLGYGRLAYYLSYVLSKNNLKKKGASKNGNRRF